MTFPPEVWDGVLRRLNDRLSPAAVETWIRPLVPTGSETGLQLRCPSQFHLARVRARFLPHIVECASLELGHRTPISLETGASGSRARACAPRDRAPEERARTRATPAPARRAQPTPTPGPASQGEAAAPASGRAPSRPNAARRVRRQQYNFENFVIGPGNALACQAARALAENGEHRLDRLFLASPPGYGKTHLALSTVGEARRLGRRGLYCSAETFTNEFMAAVRTGKMGDFKRRFRRDCDLLVVEDVGFFAGKAQTQLEFFHTVQHVLDCGGQVLVTGHRLPRDLSELEERVRSQLASGLVAEIEPPDAAIRRNILRAKAAAGGVRLPAECLDLLVDQVRGSVRELEGVLIQLVATATLLGRAIDLALTREAFAKKCGDAPGGRLDPDAVIEVVAAFFQKGRDALSARSRRRDLLVPRQLAMYLCHRYTDASLAEIGRAFGRDHPSVKNAVARVERAILERAPLRYQVEELCSRLEQRSATR
jgi:chromosomal replication initiator protein